MGTDQSQAPEHEQKRKQRDGRDDAYGQGVQSPIRLPFVFDQEKKRRTHAGDDSEKNHDDEYFRQHGGSEKGAARKYTPGAGAVIRAHSMRIGAYELRVAALPAVAVLIMLALLVSAGLWQMRRAEEKRAIAVEQAYRAEKQAFVLEPALSDSTRLETLRYRQASASGHYRGDRQYLLDNRTHNRIAGYHVLTPFRLQGSDVHVLVNRGWVPVGPDRRQLPDIAVSQQAMTQQGLIVAPPASGLDLGVSGYDDAGWPRVVQRVDFSRIQQQLGSPLLPLVLRLSPTSDYGYVRAWQIRTGLTPERHVGYAVQWFALAATLVGLSLWVAVKRAPDVNHEH